MEEDIFDMISQSELVILTKVAGVGASFIKEIDLRLGLNEIGGTKIDDVLADLATKNNTTNLVRYGQLEIKKGVSAFMDNQKIVEGIRQNSINNNNVNIILTHRYKSVVEDNSTISNVKGGSSLIYLADLVISLREDSCTINKNRRGPDLITLYYKDILRSIIRKRKINELLNFPENE
jgi:hypothetical protein